MNTNALADEELEQIKRYQDFTTIDWIQDSILERNRRLQDAKRNSAAGYGPRTASWFFAQARRAIHAGQSWFVVSLVGVCIGLNAAIISIVTEWLSDLKMGYCSDGWWLDQNFCCWEIEGGDTDVCDSWHPWSTVSTARGFVYTAFAGTFAFVAAHLVRSLAKYAAGSGISEIKCILAGFTMQGFLGFTTFFVKSITLPLVIASGLSVGKEGPSVHVACCIGYFVATMFKRFAQSEGKMREVVTAASAAGVAVAFGSPIGGVLFSIEEMSHAFSIRTMWRSFFCALMATVTLAAMNPFRTGKLVLFQVTYDRDWHFFEIIFFVILGIFGGLYGALVIKFNLQVATFRRKYLAKHGVAEAVFLALITALIGYPNRFLRIDMTESMAVLFRECDGDVDNICETATQWRIANSLILATVIRIILVILSYGAKVPAGIFVPSMAIGATFGRTVGIIVRAMYRTYPQSGIFAWCDPNVPCITPGTYAFLGAAAALSGIMRITVTVVVIMFELTGALTYILPTMIVLLVTKAVGDMLGVNGIADEMIRFNGFPFLEKEDHAFGVDVSAVMKHELHVLTETGMMVQDIERVLAATDVKGFPIVSTDGFRTLIGYIGRTELLFVLERFRKVREVNDETPCSFKSSGAGGHQHLGMDEDANANVFESASSSEGLQFWPWVNQTPMTVSPQLPLEIVMQLFKRMGPRVILVEDHGMLTGLVTVKDVLTFIATEKFDHDPSFEERGGLDGLLEELWRLTTGVTEQIRNWGRRFRGR
ncbi:Cl-channel protein [Cylindrobasidium torrendii FP15055 ss-10]|uniref:Chloride channel protein n=1 Tax=Cylindrobasidium torrendii FP15055 ss-10 TaxID=1314674 RepID=A0A0D7BK64_9AGAR|nr:Cl-channel protein [Cylindrobasidium torrendii FP15055 ss-10]